MIPRAYITAWRTSVPWAADVQVEQDLILVRSSVTFAPSWTRGSANRSAISGQLALRSSAVAGQVAGSAMEGWGARVGLISSGAAGQPRPGIASGP